MNNLDDAHELIDTAISTALKESKPVYISISCNLPAIPHPTFSHEPVPFYLSPRLDFVFPLFFPTKIRIPFWYFHCSVKIAPLLQDLPCFSDLEIVKLVSSLIAPIRFARLSNQMGLECAVAATAEFLNKAVKPVLVGGPKLRAAKAGEAFTELADVCGYPVAVMPSAKGLVPENLPRFIGTYWGAVSTAFCAEIVESADAYLFAGPIFNDYSSVGYSLLLKQEKAIIVQPDRVIVANGPAFGCILMKDFFHALAKRLKKNTTAHENYSRIFVPEGHPLKCQPKEPLRVNVLFKHVQSMLSGGNAVIAETGDSWFNCQKLKLPEGCGYEFQMQYGSIGWSVGATLGYAQAAKDKRVIAFIGDGSFQVTNSVVVFLSFSDAMEACCPRIRSRLRMCRQ